MQSFKNKAIPLIENNGEVFYDNNFLSNDQAVNLYDKMLKNIAWGEYPIKMFGKTFLQPRLIAWYGDAGIQYRYSKTTFVANSWNTELLYIKEKLKENLGLDFNSVLLNLYRNGQDSMGWHSDNEKELGINPVIASISLGATRQIQFRQTLDHRQKIALNLESGSLLLMQGATQHHWQHQIPKTAKVEMARMNLTFRNILL